MRKMFLLMSHKLTQKQIEDAQNSYDIEEFVRLPDRLQNIWSNISPHEKLLKDILLDIKTYLNQNAQMGDYCLVQGDFGATYQLVNYCFKQKLVPLYATTERISNDYEHKDKIIKQSTFKHMQFRVYEVE